MTTYQGKRPDQIEFSERVATWAFIAFIVITLLLVILS